MENANGAFSWSAASANGLRVETETGVAAVGDEVLG